MIENLEADEIRIGISTCLLGENVRYDGSHKHDAFLTETVGPFVQWVPVCPEIEVGMGVPRPSVRLELREDGVRMIEPDSGKDHTPAMERYSRRRVKALESLDLSGYVLKSKSPSCGMERVKLYRAAMSTKDGVGIFARILMESLPLLPVEEEGRLHDPGLRENFFERVFAYGRVKRLFASGRWSLGQLVTFHSDEKLLLLAHDPKAYGELGRLVANAKGRPKAEVAEEYSRCYLTALRKLATRGRHTNVLQHMAGYFKNDLTTGEKQELLGTIDDYRAGLVPLIVPLTLVKHHVHKLGVEYLARQRYLAPHPKELMLRNHV